MRENENKDMIILFGVIAASILVILISILGLDIPVVPVCVLVLIEAALAACLHDVPIWVHILTIVVQLVAGILCGNTVFIILCLVIYVLGILSFRFAKAD